MRKHDKLRKDAPRVVPRDLQTRSNILRAAGDLFAQIGFEAASTKVIAAHARVPTGSIFYHFGSKEGLLDEIFSETVIAGMQRAFESSDPRADPIDGLTSVANALYQWLTEHTVQARILFREITSHRPIAGRLLAIRKRAITLLARHLDEYVESGRLASIDSRIAAQALSSSLLFAVVVDHPEDPASYVKELVHLMFRPCAHSLFTH